MSRIKELEKRLAELAREIAELKILLAQRNIVVIDRQPVTIPNTIPPVPIKPWPGYPNPYIGDWPPAYPPQTTWSSGVWKSDARASDR